METIKKRASWIPIISVIVALLFTGVVIVNNPAIQQMILPKSTKTPATPTTPIKHIVIIMQENHAFDNYFGVYPGLLPQYTLDLNVCMPYSLTNSSEGCLKPFDADNESTFVQDNDLDHGWGSYNDAFNNGSMNGFITAQEVANVAYPNLTMAYYTNRTVPNYWDLASYYALDANFFQSELGYTLPNHYYLIAGQAGGYTSSPEEDYDMNYTTIINQLESNGISWAYYSFGWNDSYDCQPMNNHLLTQGDVNADVDEQPLVNFPAVQDNTSSYFGNPPVCTGLQNEYDMIGNLTNGYLPSVSWVMTNNTGNEHPFGTGPYGIFNGQQYTSYIIDSIESNPTLWNSTAIFLTYDEAGGYYSTLRPPQVDAYGYGFQIPLIAISPYVESGKIFYGHPFGQGEDISALLSTIEANWGLHPITSRDADDASLFYMFNFNQQPLEPLFLPLATNLAVNSSGLVQGDLAVYPVSTCLKTLNQYTGKPLCSIGGYGPSTIIPSGPPGSYYPPPKFLNYTAGQLQQEANYSGDDDPFD